MLKIPTNQRHLFNISIIKLHLKKAKSSREGRKKEMNLTELVLKVFEYETE